ncbi:hypothetical protein HNQ60_005488 [Povalibacter uvarum]|uniref:Uncharacterized protein n=1 Tax=Povalibacter uvarum TaxID=732238 RepID=A0A841HUH6_9GAMM|nr:hypothetical protein [Povalibacter uvarum]MBB6096566.1 hypothetical protein [Povalibacter uvarum]
MRISNVVGLLGGMAFTATGLFCLVAFDCRTSLIFPITASKSLKPIVEEPFALSCCECVVSPSGVLWLACIAAMVFMISGALASRIGETKSPGRGALAVGLVFGATLLQAATSGGEIDVAQTTLIGVGALLGAIACAYGAAYLAIRNAQQAHQHCTQCVPDWQSPSSIVEDNLDRIRQRHLDFMQARLGSSEGDVERDEIPERYLGFGVALGAAVGVAMGTAFGVALGNLAWGIGFGLCIGAGVGIALGAVRGNKQA